MITSARLTYVFGILYHVYMYLLQEPNPDDPLNKGMICTCITIQFMNIIHLVFDYRILVIINVRIYT